MVNGIFHLVPMVVQRRYNPGLATALLLLLPVGGWCVARVGYGAGLLPHATGLLAAIAVHVALVGPILVRARLMRPAEPGRVSESPGEKGSDG
ncbi:MAG: HXXEE domain-containing protein [Rhizobiales bacterium]|nr:HXXEE domain-containing protein [Hyphomicrobiales bacterium]